MDSTNLILSPQVTSYLDRIVAMYRAEILRTKTAQKEADKEIIWGPIEAALVDFSEMFGKCFVALFFLSPYEWV